MQQVSLFDNLWGSVNSLVLSTIRIYFILVVGRKAIQNVHKNTKFCTFFFRLFGIFISSSISLEIFEFRNIFYYNLMIYLQKNTDVPFNIYYLFENSS